jgi:hypothetical protein
MTKKNKKPELVNLSLKDLDDIKSRVSETHLGNDDKKIILSILTTYQWLHAQLQTAKFSLHRLKKMFGFTTEKRSAAKKIIHKTCSILILSKMEASYCLIPHKIARSLHEKSSKAHLGS